MNDDKNFTTKYRTKLLEELQMLHISEGNTDLEKITKEKLETIEWLKENKSERKKCEDGMSRDNIRITCQEKCENEPRERNVFEEWKENRKKINEMRKMFFEEKYKFDYRGRCFSDVCRADYKMKTHETGARFRNRTKSETRSQVQQSSKHETEPRAFSRKSLLSENTQAQENKPSTRIRYHSTCLLRPRLRVDDYSSTILVQIGSDACEKYLEEIRFQNRLVITNYSEGFEVDINRPPLRKTFKTYLQLDCYPEQNQTKATCSSGRDHFRSKHTVEKNKRTPIFI